MAAERGKVVNDEARRWVGGQLPTAEYYAKAYAEERARAEVQVEHALRLRRSRRRAASTRSASISTDQ
jgi:hypothetical protein